MKGNTKNEHSKESSLKGIGTMNVILIIVGVSLLAFTVAMIILFSRYGAIPDTLVTCVFAALGGECGVMGWIKTTKDRNRERNWELQDRTDSGQPQQNQQLEQSQGQPSQNQL